MSEYPWLAHYDPGVPHSLAPYPQTSLLDIIQATAEARPEHPALLFKGSQLSYASLERLTNEFRRCPGRPGGA